ncbi:hypothetical protein D3C72_909500 [compost metagenome]
MVILISGTDFVIELILSKGYSKTLATSLSTAFAPSVPKVPILATYSQPYFSLTYSITSVIRSIQKSKSTSGKLMRSTLRKRSNNRSYINGSTSVMCKQYKTKEPAPEPRPLPTGMSSFLQKRRTSSRIKK